MATLSEDGDSWKASGIKRRDFRSIKNGPEVPRRSGQKKKKNTKRWCRGVEGKEHTFNHIKKYSWYHIDKCNVCGKETEAVFAGFRSNRMFHHREINGVTYRCYF